MRRSQTSPLLSIKHRWWFWLQPASIVLIWSLQSSSSNPSLDWPSICLNLIIVDKVIAPSWRWDITSFPPQPLHTTSQCKDHLSFFLHHSCSISTTNSHLRRCPPTWRWPAAPSVASEAPATVSSERAPPERLSISSHLLIYHHDVSQSGWHKRTPGSFRIHTIIPIDKTNSTLKEANSSKKIAPCNFLWRSRTCCRGRREGGRSCPWTPPDHYYGDHDGHDRDSYDDES